MVGKLFAECGRFLPVKLQRVQPALDLCLGDQFLGRVNKHTHQGNKWRQFTGDFRNGCDRNIARAPFVEHEAQRVGAGLDRCHRIVRVRNAADLDLQAHADLFLFLFGVSRLVLGVR